MMSGEGAGISSRGRGELALLTGRGRRLVSVGDAAATLEVDRATAAKRLARWAEQGWLRRIRRGLYIPVPVEAENPRTWSEDPLVLADAVWAPCYFTGWTAANHWGLTEQIFHTTVLKTTQRVRLARQRLLEHEYLLAHISGRSLEWGIVSVWRGERKVRVADPGRTVVDALDAPHLAGGIRLGTEMLAAYLDEHDWHALVEHADHLGNRAVFKRLGYLVETSELDQAPLLEECRKRVSAGLSLLDPGAPETGPRISEWGLRANVLIEPAGSS